MTDRTPQAFPLFYARMAGLLYLLIIIFGVSSEALIRSGLIVPGNETATASNILASQGLFRMGFVTDSVMFLCDVGLAVLLFILLKPVSKTLALTALFFRLTQTAVIAVNLLNYHAAMLLLTRPGYAAAFEPSQLHSLTSMFLDLHAHGYDLGLIPFGVHCIILGYLILKSLYIPKTLGILMMAGGVTYLVGSYTRFLFPEYVAAVSPIYVVARVSESALCLWLLIKGVNPTAFCFE